MAQHDTPTSGVWDTRYREPTRTGEAAQILRFYTHLLPRQGKALDLACGLGANALLLASHGLETSAWDFSPVAIARLNELAQAQHLILDTQVRDVLQEPPLAEQFDLITVTRFLDRQLTAVLMGALRPGGLLFYETFVHDKVAPVGPENPAFLLAENELLGLFSGLRVRAYHEEGSVGDPTQGIRNVAMLVAQKPAKR